MTPVVFEHSGVRAYEVQGDYMAPTLRSGDFLMVRHARGYDGEGVYILDFRGDGGAAYRAERVPVMGRREVRICHDNPAYSRHVIGLDEFNDVVRAKVVAEVRMKVSRAQLMEMA
ncbi:hypothetical protein GCM10017620_24860 [Brevundimonas intermedia]|uniref:S24 family peptidase n=1 Tax=Brevundimonas intermedia TaxID=74315 RepID=A0ABQ5TE31_9CAUL|nr:S24 family peptidase [Brevundimonas intermedia]GLK49513.1 hypothetical protein GCM10017620_24860 [Brevundimonas intermedia]